MQPVAVRPTSVAAIERPDADSRVVLVVTADVNLREAAKRVLTRGGYAVLTAAHAGHAVLACMQAHRVDLAAIELSMDDCSGPALSQRLRRHHGELRAVYFAKAGTPECEGVLVRPFTRDDLLAELARAACRV